MVVRDPRQRAAAARNGDTGGGAGSGTSGGVGSSTGEGAATAGGTGAGTAATAAGVRDLRRSTGLRPGALVFAPGDLVVVSGLPGSGKSTLIRRAAEGAVDSQDARERWAGRLPLLPYVLYRPVVRLAHYAGLWRLLRAGRSAVVHDCGTQRWVRGWLARTARGRGRALHLVLLDVPPEVARAGQRARGRAVSRYAFARHRVAVARLLAAVETAGPPAGCRTAVLLDRDAAGTLAAIVFTAADRPGPATARTRADQGG
ncbi:AAA family ATPase [Streptomyces sp. DW26H14]|uniref:AAA family ATPase n=1 Tax=Streptomyces sp. DW26H14 TaxID=3435395 RepID=UPI00403DD692